jgi:hypothetical protein
MFNDDSYIEVAKVNEIPSGKMMHVEFNDNDITIANLDGANLIKRVCSKANVNMNSGNPQQLVFYHSSLIHNSYNLCISLKVKATERTRANISDKIHFLICRTCLWCASYFKLDKSSISSCPLCRSNHIEQLPLSDNHLQV